MTLARSQDHILVLDVFDATSANTFKGAVHLTLGMLAAVCCAYNAGAALIRPSRRLIRQSVIYGVLAVYETRQTWEHWRR